MVPQSSEKCGGIVSLVEPNRARRRWGGMVGFPIDPEIRLRHRRCPVLGTIGEAAQFSKRMAAEHPGTAWQDMAKLLERVRTEDEALEAAVALEMLLEREAMLIPVAASEKGAAAVAQPAPDPAPHPQPNSAPALSIVFGAAPAAPST
jgi:hypothetical protein